MKFIHYLYIVPLAFLAACSSEEKTTTEIVDPKPTEKIDNGPIVLSAGIVEGGSQVVTRGAETGENTTNHGNHLALTNGTKLALRVSGTWTGHSPSTDIIYTTTGTVGDKAGTDNLHNAVSCDPVLYWDDYGTADPANSATGRTTGLTIYGAAIDNYKDGVSFAISSDLSSISNVTDMTKWTALSWTLAADQTASGYIASKDLLISNNVSSLTSSDYPTYKLDCGTYKFDDYYTYKIGKLLEFHHAMSKITVNLKAGAGFTSNQFAATPTVTLTSNFANQTSETEWAYIKGTVNVTTGTITPSSDGKAAITMAAGTPTSALSSAGYTKTKEALVMPGSVFKKNANIIRINADGNIYYVNANKIRAAINSTAHDETDDLTLAGKNYIFNIIVNKTDIVVTATVTDWTTVTAAEVEPVINVSKVYGTSDITDDNAFSKENFSFYRSTSFDNGYSNDASLLINNKYYKEEAYISKSGLTWTMHDQLYWPDHNTHYQFRGVWPRTNTNGETTTPCVKTSDTYQVIKVWNVAYDDDTFPSDLQIGRPDVSTTAECTNTDAGHTKTNLYSGGICATEGKINLAFKYMMSQVEVNLTTSDPTATGSLHDDVALENAVVEIVNVHKTGEARLGSLEVVATGVVGSPADPANDSYGDYTLDNYTYTAKTETEPAKANYHSAIVPQELTYSSAHLSTNMMFRITITNTNGTEDTSDDTKDVYYADIAPIKKKSSTDYIAKYDSSANKWYWESGYHYVYNLYLTKTKVEVTATLASWTKVEASENVWF